MGSPGRDLPEIGLFGWSAHRRVADAQPKTTLCEVKGVRRREPNTRTRPTAELQVEQMHPQSCRCELTTRLASSPPESCRAIRIGWCMFTSLNGPASLETASWRST